MIWKWNFFLLAICTICADPLGTEGRGKEDGKERRRCSFVIFTVISYFTTRVCSFEKFPFILFALIWTVTSINEHASIFFFQSGKRNDYKCGDFVFPFHSRIRIVSIEFRKFSHLESSTSVLHMFSPHQLSDRYFLRPRTILHIAVT